MISIPKKFFTGLLLIWVYPVLSLAQINQDYLKANQLYRQQDFKKAYELFEQLHRENRSNFIFLEKATESLMQLKEYDRAVALLKEAEHLEMLQPDADIQRGEIYHLRGDTAEAYTLWNQTLQDYPQDRQVHLEVARAMEERRAFDKAIAVYEQLRADSSPSNLIITELADVYLQAGYYEQAIRSFLELLREDPNQISFVQNRLLRFQDDHVYGLAIAEIDDLLGDLPISHPAYRQLQQMEVWLLMERRLFERALVTARQFEKQTPQTSYLLYSLGDKLLAEQKFELAEQAYTFYIDNDTKATKYRSMEALAGVYRSWAQYLEQHNLSLSPQRMRLYQEAFSTYERIYSEAPDYQRMDRVLTALSEMSLDILHHPQKAQQYLQDLQQRSDTALSAQKKYLQGRLYLYERDYTNARRAFTESNKQSKEDKLPEKSRYYLALTDFYTGDYEFAKIQLQALERENDSFYANDAIKLRLWIQTGLQADSTGRSLDPVARAVEYFSHGKQQLGINELKPLLQDGFSNPLTADALLELNAHKDADHFAYTYRVTDHFLSAADRPSPLHERLLWERARLADQIVTSEQMPEVPADQRLSGSEESMPNKALPDNVDQLIPLYADVLMHFPNGFYASMVRERIQELQNF